MLYVMLVVLFDLSEEIKDHWLLPPDYLRPHLAADGYPLR
jgi:hypothetical protein